MDTPNTHDNDSEASSKSWVAKTQTRLYENKALEWNNLAALNEAYNTNQKNIPWQDVASGLLFGGAAAFVTAKALDLSGQRPVEAAAISATVATVTAAVTHMARKEYRRNTINDYKADVHNKLSHLDNMLIRSELENTSEQQR